MEISRKSTCGMRHRRTGDMAQRYGAPTFARWGTPPARVPHSPPSWYQSTSPPRRKRPFAAHARVVGGLRRATISSSRARLYPPSKAARLSSCSRPGAVRSLSCVRHGCIVMSRTQEYDDTSGTHYEALGASPIGVGLRGDREMATWYRLLWPPGRGASLLAVVGLRVSQR